MLAIEREFSEKIHSFLEGVCLWRRLGYRASVEFPPEDIKVPSLWQFPSRNTMGPYVEHKG